MDTTNIEICRNERINELKEILEVYRATSVPRKSISIITFLLMFCGVVLYFALSFWLGGLWGFFITLAVVMIGVYCYSQLDIKIKNIPISIGNLACRAYIAMDALIKIKKGTYCQYCNIIQGCEGKHLITYKEFSQLYPDLACKDLEKLSKIAVTREDKDEIFTIHE